MNEFNQSLETEISIRRALPEDAEPLFALRLEALANHPTAFAADYESSKAEGAAFWRRRLEGFLSKNIGVIYLATVGDKLVGMTGLYCGDRPKTRHGGMIWGVYVQDAWRGRWVAESLIETCLDWGRENGVIIARLGVAVDNIPAIRCYSQCGFTVYGIEEKAVFYKGNYYDELLMVKPI